MVVECKLGIWNQLVLVDIWLAITIVCICRMHFHGNYSIIETAWENMYTINSEPRFLVTEICERLHCELKPWLQHIMMDQPRLLISWHQWRRRKRLGCLLQIELVEIAKKWIWTQWVGPMKGSYQSVATVLMIVNMNSKSAYTVFHIDFCNESIWQIRVLHIVGHGRLTIHAGAATRAFGISLSFFR